MKLNLPPASTLPAVVKYLPKKRASPIVPPLLHLGVHCDFVAPPAPTVEDASWAGPIILTLPLPIVDWKDWSAIGMWSVAQMIPSVLPVNLCQRCEPTKIKAFMLGR